MADVPAGGLYPWSPTAAQVVDGRLRVGGTRFGPAGVSMVELPDGSSWQVDHVDPGRLVAIEIDLDGDEPPPLLIAAFGPEGATELLESASSLTDTDGDVADEEPGFVGSGPSGGLTGPTTLAGRLVRLADLAADPTITPIAGIAATAEVVRWLDGTPGGDLIAPILPSLLDRADDLAAEVSDASLVLDAKFAARVSGAVEALARFDVSPRPGFEQLLVRLSASPRRSGRGDGRITRRRRAEPSERAQIAAMRSDPRTGDGLHVEWVTGSLARVTAAPGGEDRWVRALHVRGLVLLAQAPLERGSDHDVADLVLPPVLEPDDVHIEVVRQADLHAAAARPIDLIRRAIRIGRMAASDEFGGRTSRAATHWSECAGLWFEVGDEQRAEAARQRSIDPWRDAWTLESLADEIGPYD